MKLEDFVHRVDELLTLGDAVLSTRKGPPEWGDLYVDKTHFAEFRTASLSFWRGCTQLPIRPIETLTPSRETEKRRQPRRVSMPQRGSEHRGRVPPSDYRQATGNRLRFRVF